jgi:transcriptional regulator with XRE-family HTH domain
MDTIMIGQVIKQRVEALGMSKAELARRLNMSSANVHKIFKRTSLDIEMLRQLGAALHYDFISHYQYLTINRMTSPRLLSVIGHDSTPVYAYSLFRKIIQVLTASRESIARAPELASTDLLLSEIDFLHDVLKSINHNYQAKPNDHDQARRIPDQKISQQSDCGSQDGLEQTTHGRADVE